MVFMIHSRSLVAVFLGYESSSRIPTGNDLFWTVGNATKTCPSSVESPKSHKFHSHWFIAWIFISHLAGINALLTDLDESFCRNSLASISMNSIRLCAELRLSISSSFTGDSKHARSATTVWLKMFPESEHSTETSPIIAKACESPSQKSKFLGISRWWWW